MWRGDIVAVFARGTGHRTSAHPVGGPLYAAGFGIVVVMAGGLGLPASGWSVLGLSFWAIVLMLWLLSFDAQVWLLLVP
ncbi:hypothetical protein OG957_10855 [Streptomyces sp. NBC_01718]